MSGAGVHRLDQICASQKAKMVYCLVFFFQAEDGIRDLTVTGVQTCALPILFSLDADFDFGAILTIRSQGFFADPDGFSQIAFGLWNAARTGLKRTSFPSDSFDLVEFDYFPNVTPFGGPFVSPTVFGGNVADNAFFNFAFNSAETTLPLDTPLLVQCHYNAALRRLNVKVSRHVR